MAKSSKKQVEGLSEEFIAGLDVSPGVLARIKTVAAQMMEEGLPLSAGDYGQLAELAALLTRTESIDTMMADASDEPALWLRLAKQRDAQAGLQRMLLRDMKVTRAARITTQTKASEIKANQRSGSDWDGVI